MNKWIANKILDIAGWKRMEYPHNGNCVVGMAPHTSMWDFFWGRTYFVALGLSPKVFIKKEMFFFPLKYILKKIGGIPVDRKNPRNLTKDVAELFKTNSNMILVLTPEGTREKTSSWKKGFIHIAQMADVPIVVGYMDYKKKEMGIADVMSNKGDPDEIMIKFKNNFKNIEGKHPEKFTI